MPGGNPISIEIVVETIKKTSTLTLYGTVTMSPGSASIVVFVKIENCTSQIGSIVPANSESAWVWPALTSWSPKSEQVRRVNAMVRPVFFIPHMMVSRSRRYLRTDRSVHTV